jgi:hypothetical protein
MATVSVRAGRSTPQSRNIVYGRPEWLGANPPNSHPPSQRGWELFIAGFTALAVAAGVVLGLFELGKSNHLQKDQNRLQQAALDSHLNEVMMNFDRHFVAYPQLRKYFYLDEKGRQTQPPHAVRLRAQALSTAELVIDFADDVASYVRERKVPPATATHWKGIVEPYFNESPVTRYAWWQFHDAYGPDTADILGAPFGDKMRGWDWRTNKYWACARTHGACL